MQGFVLNSQKTLGSQMTSFLLSFAKAHFKNGLKKDCTKIIKICAMKLCLLILITADFACVIDEIIIKFLPLTSSMGKILLKPWTKIRCLTLSFSLDWHARKSHGHFRYRLSKFCFHFPYIWKFIYFFNPRLASTCNLHGRTCSRVRLGGLEQLCSRM